jgi:hypothetical protein
MNPRLWSISLLVGCAVATPGQAQTLWQNARVGMSIDELLAAEPRAEKAAVEDADPLSDGATCDAAIPTLVFANHDFRTCFYFQDAKLLQVTFKTKGGVTKRVYREVVKAVAAQLGKPRETEEGFLLATDWGEEKGFHASVIAKAPDLLNINYQYGVRPWPRN